MKPGRRAKSAPEIPSWTWDMFDGDDPAFSKTHTSFTQIRQHELKFLIVTHVQQRSDEPRIERN
jgi:hypothetical protein